jgi:homoserine O-acetyltransferase
MDYFDLSRDYGSLPQAFAKSTEVAYLIVSFTSDWLYPTYHSRQLVSALTAVGGDVTYCNLQSTWGHDAFLLEVETMTGLIANFLKRIVMERNISLPQPFPAMSPAVSGLLNQPMPVALPTGADD